MEHLKRMKEKLVNCVETEINGNLECTNTQELGEAVDMIKDLSEAIYYVTITEAMEGKGKYGHETSKHNYNYYPNDNVMYYPGNDTMYASGKGGYMTTRYTGGMYDKSDYMNPHYPDHNRYYQPPHYPSEPIYSGRDMEYDGRSPIARRRYMDSKRMNDKNSQMRELEQYTQELTNDLVDMIKDASPEEKQLLQQKITLLASKIK